MVVLMRIAILLFMGMAAAGQEVHIVRMLAERFSFTPSLVKVRQGETVEMRLRSDDTNHGFLIPALGINAIIPKRGRGEVKVRFVADRKGRFDFECSKACGAGHTIMRGTLVVE